MYEVRTHLTPRMKGSSFPLSHAMGCSTEFESAHNVSHNHVPKTKYGFRTQSWMMDLNQRFYAFAERPF